MVTSPLGRRLENYVEAGLFIVSLFRARPQ